MQDKSFPIKLFGRIILVSAAWADKGLWWVTEKNDTVRQHFLVNVSWMEALNPGDASGLAITIFKLMIMIGWLNGH